MPGCLVILRGKAMGKLEESMRGPPVLTAELVSEQWILRQDEISSYGQDRLASDVRGPEFLVVSIHLLRKVYFIT